MCKSKSFFTCFFFGLIFVAKSQGGQVFVNREYQSEFGAPLLNPLLNPFGIQWSASINSVYGGVITVGHTSVGGQEDILLRKLDIDGNVIFSLTKNVAGTQNDYGTSVAEDPISGDIYICGTTDNNTSTNYDIVLYHFNSTGSIIDSAIFAGGSNLNDIGVAIKIHPITGEIIVAATSEDFGNSYDYLVLKYSPTLNSVIATSYDYAGLIDVPLGIEFGATGEICLIGASASGITNWDYCLAQFDFSTLNFVTETRSNITGVGFDQPLAFCKDAAQNVYITGRASTNGINYDIRTIKILSDLTTIAWSVVYDGSASLEDAGSSIGVDQNGNVIVGGFITNSSNLKERIVRKLNGSTGTLMWEQIQPSEDPLGNSLVKKVAISQTSGNVYYLASQLGLSGFNEVLVGRLDKNGSKSWERSVKVAGSDIFPSDLDLAADGLYACSILDSTLDKYILTKYNDKQFDTTRFFNSNGKAACKKNELIVSFMPSMVNYAAIDNTIDTKIMEFGRAQDFLIDTAATLFYNALYETCKDCDVTFSRIFTSLKTTDTISISRLGQNVPVPAFWSTLLLQFPPSITIQQAETALKNIPNVVSFSHPNVFIYPLTAPPNDSLYNAQTSLHPPTSSGPIADINVEEAWNVEPSGGRSYVKGGVFDTGIHWRHSDFGYDGSTAASSKIDGWDFYPNGNGQPLKNNIAITDSFGHGTAVAGIINANRNNMTGIAGIAGGNSATGNPGVQLYSLNIVGFSIAIALNSILETSRGGYYAPFGFPIDFSNNSWRVEIPLWSNTQLDALREQVHFAWRNSVTFVVARGDDGSNNVVYPATYDSTWVLSVGGTGSDGLYKGWTTEETWWAASYGSGIDVAAPAVYNLVNTLIYKFVYPTIKYAQLNETSAAAAHVSGIVGLLMTQQNDTSGLRRYKNLAPEDSEYLITHTANNYPSYDTLVGFGLVNAGKALKMIDKSKYNLLHFGTNSLTPYTISKSPTAFNQIVRLTENYTKPFTQQVFSPGKYKVNIFYIYANVYHNISSTNDSIMYSWERHSSCYVYDLPQGPNNLLNMHEREKINFLSQSSAALQGYIYEVMDTLGSPLGWWPCDTSFSALTAYNQRPKTVFEYSILTKNKNIVGIAKNSIEQLNVRLFPNPASKSQNIVIDTDKESDCVIEMFDLMGRHLKTVYKGKTSVGQTTITHNLDNLPNSMYIYNIKVDGKTTSKKFIKEQ